MITANKVREDALYTLAYRPGLTGHRQGVYWHDGLAGPVPGYMVKAMVGKMDFHIFDYPCDLQWKNAVPYRREAVATKLEIPDVVVVVENPPVVEEKVEEPPEPESPPVEMKPIELRKKRGRPPGSKNKK